MSLMADDTFGFIVMDGNGALFGTLSGNARTVLHKFSVDLPRKNGRGGMSALRYARLRMGKRHDYVREVCGEAVRLFISDDKVWPCPPAAGSAICPLHHTRLP